MLSSHDLTTYEELADVLFRPAVVAELKEVKGLQYLSLAGTLAERFSDAVHRLAERFLLQGNLAAFRSLIEPTAHIKKPLVCLSSIVASQHAPTNLSLHNATPLEYQAMSILSLMALNSYQGAILLMEHNFFHSTALGRAHAERRTARHKSRVPS